MCACARACVHAPSWVYTPYVYRSPYKAEEGVRAPGTGISGNCELPCGCWEPSPDLLLVPDNWPISLWMVFTPIQGDLPPKVIWELPLTRLGSVQCGCMLPVDMQSWSHWKNGVFVSLLNILESHKCWLTQEVIQWKLFPSAYVQTLRPALLFGFVSIGDIGSLTTFLIDLHK